VLLRVATAVVGVAFAAGLSSMVWDAAHSTGLIVEPFAVPSDMAAKLDLGHLQLRRRNFIQRKLGAKVGVAQRTCVHDIR
jgi:hypothetical protein